MMKKKSQSAKKEATQSSEPIRLNKFIANAGVCSRREADKLIAAGEVTVNGEVITEMGYKVSLTDKVTHNGKKLSAESPVYLLLNKPKGFITTTDDPHERKTVMDLVKTAGPERIYPVGRLDRATTGLLLFTNDGDLAVKLAHPSNNIKKIYRVEIDKEITNADFDKISDGLKLEDGPVKVDKIAILEDKKTLGLEIHVGKNRIVRRIFEHLGYEVLKLDRVVYAGLDKTNLPRGKWRMLTDKEVFRLKNQKS
ncbi:MAG TPA: pseudouridine synthase [Fulvivirga sp.]|nr:pseudouridine synthase [Fulvivirga sp.]